MGIIIPKSTNLLILIFVSNMMTLNAIVYPENTTHGKESAEKFHEELLL